MRSLPKLVVYLVFFLISKFHRLSALANNQAPWIYTMSNYPQTYYWSLTGLPFNVAFYNVDTYTIKTSNTQSCVQNNDYISCLVNGTYPPSASSKFTFSYSSGGSYFQVQTGGSAPGGGCQLYLTNSLTCYSDTIRYSGTTEQVVIYVMMVDATTTSCASTDRNYSDMQAVNLLVDCSRFTSSSTSTSTTTTSTSTTTTTPTTSTTTQTTTTVFAQSPGGIATIVVSAVVGAALVALIGYGIYKCCIMEEPVIASPVNNVKEVIYENDASLNVRTAPPASQPKQTTGPTMTDGKRVYNIQGDGTPAPTFGSRGQATVYI